MLKLLKSFAKNESGATALDYALILALTIVGVIGGLNML